MAEMKNKDLLELVAQMLYEKAKIASDAEECAITLPIQEAYRHKCLAYCAAAEDVRRMKTTLPE